MPRDATARRRRERRPARDAAALTQSAWSPVRYRHPPLDILSAEAVDRIHDTALRILEDVGMRVLAPEARALYAKAGFDVDDANEQVRFDRDGLMGCLKTVPSSFKLNARNAERTLTIGDGHAVFTAVGGPAYCMDLDKGRRDGTHAEQCDFLRLVQSLNILHQEGGGGFEALDLPAETRHLDLYLAELTLMDKNWQPWGIGHVQAMDAIEMAALAFETSPEGLIETPVFSCVINTNSPLQLDIPMAEGLISMATFGQASIITPFTLSGAMSPVTVAGALTQQHAEAMAAMALTQIVRPGTPVMYGGFTSNVDMKTGSPAFGTPEYAQAAQVSGQLSRLIGAPFRSSNVTGANAPDAQAAYESMMALWGAMTGHANMIMHAAGWLGGGLTASFEKLILDAEILQMMAAYQKPMPVDEAALGLDVIKEVGPAGHFFGTQHTLDRYEEAFYAPLVSNWDNYDTWIERGAVTAEQRANAIWKQVLREYEQPPMDPGIKDALVDYVERRKSGACTPERPY